MTSSGRESKPDVELAATMRAEELVFHAKPWVRVSFSSRRASGQETARENIDSPVEPGKVYRSVRVTTRIMGRL